MSAQLPDGRGTAATVTAEPRERVTPPGAHGLPGPGTLLVGDDPGCQVSGHGTRRDRADVGIVSVQRGLPAQAVQAEAHRAGDD